MMKTTLHHLPQSKQRDLARIVETVRDGFEQVRAGGTQTWRRNGRIEKIVLFGSFARGDWTADAAGNYFSDYDVLVVVSHHKLTEPEFWHAVEDQLLPVPGRDKHEVNFIVHALSEVNEKLREGRYFFIDIIHDGILLFQRGGGKGFAKPVPATPEKALEFAEEYFELWLERGRQFLEMGKFGRANNWLPVSAFNLHQSVESLYHCLLLVRTNYTPSTHNIKQLRSLASNIAPELIQVWPSETRLQTRAFERLKRAYVEGRYSKHYEITVEELDWLEERIALLAELVAASCRARIEALKGSV